MIQITEEDIRSIKKHIASKKKLLEEGVSPYDRFIELLIITEEI